MNTTLLLTLIYLAACGEHGVFRKRLSCLAPIESNLWPFGDCRIQSIIGLEQPMVQRAGKWMAKFESSEAFKQNAFKWCGCYQVLCSHVVKPFQEVLHKSLQWLLPQVWLALDELVGED